MKEKPIEELMKWNYTEGFQLYMTEIVRLALEATKDSDKVVLSHTTFLKPMRTFLRKLHMDAGAKDVMVMSIMMITMRLYALQCKLVRLSKN